MVEDILEAAGSGDGGYCERPVKTLRGVEESVAVVGKDVEWAWGGVG